MSPGGTDQSKPSTSTPTTPKDMNLKAKKMHVTTPSDNKSPRGNEYHLKPTTDKQEVQNWDEHILNETFISSIINDPHNNKALTRRRKSDKLYFNLATLILPGQDLPSGAKERGTWVEKLKRHLKRMVELMKNFMEMGQTSTRTNINPGGRRRPGSSCPRVYSGIWR